MVLLIALPFAENIGLLLLICAAGIWYATARLASAFTQSGSASPLMRAVGYALPVAALLIELLRSGQPGAAIGVVLSTSVACLSLVTGTVLLTTPQGPVEIEPKRIWGFVLPAGALVFLAGFKVNIGWTASAVMLVQGVAAVLAATSERRRGNSGRTPGTRIRPLIVAVAIVLSGFGAYVGAEACRSLTHKLDLPTDGLVSSVLLAPALVLGMVGAGAVETQRGRVTDVITAHVQFVMINLCVLLPFAAIYWMLAHSGTPLKLSLSLWRVDAVLLVVLGVMHLVMSTGRWLPGRLEGAALVLMYGAYLVASRVVHL